MRTVYRAAARACLWLLAIALLAGGPAAAQSQADLKRWGLEEMGHIQQLFWMPARGLYAEDVTLGQPPDKPSFMWGCGVQLSALAAAARLDQKRYLPQVRRYVSALDAYWTKANGIGGYDVQPGPKAPDRYYDDNTWMTLALVEVYELTHDAQYRTKAEETFRFVLSGEDDTLGGGLYWHEQEHNLKGTDPNGAAAAAALRLYQITHKKEYIAAARRLYDWTNAHLQDKDGLFFDALEINGTLHPTKWSYNSALMIRANCLFYEVTHEKHYLAEAQRIAHAAEAHWVQPKTGAIADEGWFAHLLSEAFLYLYDEDHDAHWPAVVRRALGYLHDHCRDSHGNYGKRWDTPPPAAQADVPLLYQASAARAYLVAARYGGTSAKTGDRPLPVSKEATQLLTK